MSFFVLIGHFWKAFIEILIGQVLIVILHLGTFIAFLCSNYLNSSLLVYFIAIQEHWLNNSKEQCDLCVSWQFWLLYSFMFLLSKLMLFCLWCHHRSCLLYYKDSWNPWLNSFWIYPLLATQDFCFGWKTCTVFLLMCGNWFYLLKSQQLLYLFYLNGNECYTISEVKVSYDDRRYLVWSVSVMNARFSCLFLNALHSPGQLQTDIRTKCLLAVPQ